MSKSLFLILVCLYIASIFMGCFSINSKPDKDKILERTQVSGSEEAERVSVQRLYRQNFNGEIISQGNIKSRYRSDVAFEVVGKIEKIYIQVGQRVKKGQVLARLDNFIFKHELEKIEQKIAQAQFNIEEKLISLGFETNGDSIDKTLMDRLAIEFNLNAYQTDRKLAEYQLEKSKIKAPISGIVSEVEAQAGNWTSNYEKLCTIIGDDDLQVVFPILESEIMFVKANQLIIFHPLYQIDKKYEGRIIAITPEVDEYGMLTTYASIKESNKSLFEGMKVRIYIQEKIPNQLVVPKSAVVDRQGQQLVFTCKNGLAHWNYVQLGQENSQFYTIKEGLLEGDTIIIDNNLYLSHLERVIPFFKE